MTKNEPEPRTLPLESLGGHAFEDIVERLLGKMGFVIQGRQSAADGGIDMVALRDEPITGGKVIIQCKRLSSPVNVSIVRDLYGVVTSERANKGVLITSSVFTKDAIAFATDKQIELIDGSSLHGLLKRHGIAANDVASSPALAPGIGIAYAELCKRLDELQEKSHRLSEGIDFVSRKPVSLQQYSRRIAGHLETIQRVSAFVAKATGPFSDLLNRRTLSQDESRQLRRIISEVLKSLGSLIDVQRQAEAIIPPTGYSCSHDLHRHVVPEVLAQFGKIRDMLRSVVEGNVRSGELVLNLNWNVPSLMALTDQLLADKKASEAKCFVATAAFGDADSEHVLALRSFRDDFLNTTRIGRALVASYYRVSPSIAAMLSSSPRMQRLVRYSLLPLAAVARVANTRHRVKRGM